MNKKVWKIAFILTPLLMLVMTLYYSNTIIHYFQDSVYTNVKEEKIKAMNIFAHNIDDLVNAGFSWEEDGELYYSAIQLYIEMLDSDEAIYAAVLSKNYVLCTEKFDYTSTFNLFENEENRAIIINAIEKEKKGFIEISLNGETQEFHFQAIPLNNAEYWVFIGVDRTRIIERLDLDKLRIPIFIIGILFIISTMDSIWQRIIKVRRL